MEARIARLESDVSHLRADVAEIKIDVRSLRDRVDGVEHRLGAKVDGVKDSLADAKLWALFLYIGLAAVNLGALARGLGSL